MDIVKHALDDARRAAEDAGIAVAELGAAALADAQEVIRQAWGSQQIPQHNLLRALAHAGSTLLGAYRGDRCLGVTLGFLGWNSGVHLHSHMTAVVAGDQSRGVGFALKLYQRWVCLEHDVTEIRWTYDPLISRNAYFNLRKLGAEVVAFEPDFYGAMDDTVNAGDHSDRFEVRWRLDSRRVDRALHGGVGAATPGGPFVEVPVDFDLLRRTDPDAARAVRLRTREAFLRLMNGGLRPEWSDGGYVFVPADTAAEAHAEAGDVAR